MSEKKIKPEGICPYCGKEIYTNFEEHVIVCKLEKGYLSSV